MHGLLATGRVCVFEAGALRRGAEVCFDMAPFSWAPCQRLCSGVPACRRGLQLCACKALMPWL